MIFVAENLAGLLSKNRNHKANRELQQERQAYMKGIIKELLGWLVFIFIVVAASYLVITYVGQRTEVSGSSMETTLSDGDQLIVDKISYRFREPSRYDIVVFPYRYEENTYYIKGSSVFRGRRCRSWTVLSGSTDSLFMNIMEMK